MQASRVGRKRCVDEDVYSTPLIDMKYGRDGWVEHKDGNIMCALNLTFIKIFVYIFQVINMMSLS
jgi:hypothetical protein